MTLAPFPGSDVSLPIKAKQAVVGVGQAGRYLLQAARGQPVFVVLAGEERIGTGVRTEEGVVVALRETGGWDVVKSVLGGVTAESW